MFLAQGHNPVTLVRPSVSSQAPYHWTTVLPEQNDLVKLGDVKIKIFHNRSQIDYVCNSIINIPWVHWLLKFII